MRKPRVAVPGAGNYFFGMPVTYKAATSPVLDGGTLALVDTDPKALDTMLSLAKRIFKNSKSSIELIGSTDREKVIEGSDFVVLTFSHKNAYYRGMDTEIAARHGITMYSSDTIGPGGGGRMQKNPSQGDGHRPDCQQHRGREKLHGGNARPAEGRPAGLLV